MCNRASSQNVPRADMQRVLGLSVLLLCLSSLCGHLDSCDNATDAVFSKTRCTDQVFSIFSLPHFSRCSSCPIELVTFGSQELVRMR